MKALLALAALTAALAAPAAARADFRVCNVTGSRVGVAVAYRDAQGWVSEGWWNLPGSACETLLRGPLASRFYYVYALDYDRGGEWTGRTFFCTRDREFTIRGRDDCYARGLERSGFFEINTGEQRNWTVQLTDPARPTSPAEPSAPPPSAPLPAPSPNGTPR